MQDFLLLLLFFCFPYQTLLCRFEGLGREAVQAEQPGFVIGGTGTEDDLSTNKMADLAI